MAVMTYTRRQVVADLFPEFLARRAQGFITSADDHARELGLSRAALQLLSGSMSLWEDGVMTRAISRWRSPYVTNEEPRERGWSEIVRAGFAEAAADAWRITATGLRVVDDHQRRFRAHLRDLDVPAGATRSASGTLSRLAARIPTTAARATLVRRLPLPPATDPASDMVTLNRAVNELWSFRDDCHVGAWQAAGYDGPTLDVLTQIWPGRGDLRGDLKWATQGGKATFDELAKAIGAKQDPLELERRVDALAGRGDIVRADGTLRVTRQGQSARDAIEEQTDRRYFAIWDLDDAATARLGGDLRVVIDALPKDPSRS